MKRWTLRRRVLFWIALIHVSALLGAGALMLQGARGAVEEEIRAAQDGAAGLVSAALALAGPAGLEAEGLRALIERIDQPRHVRLSLLPPGAPLPAATPAAIPADVSSAPEEAAPEWFLAWVAPQIPTRMLRIEGENGPLGVIAIAAAPQDEAAEVWEDLSTLLPVWGLASAGLLLALWIAVGRALRPVGELSRALGAMETGGEASDLPRGDPDLGPISAGIDRLRAALAEAEQGRRERGRLLQGARDAERADLARDLHDELGPCLFALSVEADALEREAGGPRPARIAAIVEDIRSLHRQVLSSLHPETIGAMPLADVLEDLVGDLRRARPDLRVSLAVAADLPPTSPAADLTVYRVVQEAAVNAMRHGGADRIDIIVAPRSGAPTEGLKMDGLKITVADNGAGPGEGWREGRGLLGLRDRTALQGGAIELHRRAPAGAELRAWLTLEEA